MPTDIEVRDGQLQALQSRDDEIARLRGVLEGIAEYWNGSPNSAVNAIETVVERTEAALRSMPLQDHVWQPIKTAAPRREVWLFTPGRRLGSDAADDIRFECPANWTWATMWMPAIIPAPPMVAEQETK